MKRQWTLPWCAASLCLAVLGCSSGDSPASTNRDDLEQIGTTSQNLVASPIMGTIAYSSGTDKLAETWDIGDNTFIGGWHLSTADKIVKDRVADFDGDGFDDIIITSGWGMGILGTTGGTWTHKAMNQYGSNIGNGWILGPSDQVVAVGVFAGNTPSNAAMMILMDRSNSPTVPSKGIAFVKISGGLLSAVSVIPINGVVATGSGANMQVFNRDRFFNVGKVNGTTDAIAVLSEPAGMAVFLPSATGTHTLLARAPNNTAWSPPSGLTYTLTSEDSRLRAYGGDFDLAADGRGELVLSGPSGLAIFHLNTSTNILDATPWDLRFRLLDGQAFSGTSVKGTLHSLVKVRNYHSTSATSAVDMLFQTESGVSLMAPSNTTTVPWTFTRSANHAYGSTISPSWSFNGNDLIAPYAGDITGDGLADFILGSSSSIGLGYKSASDFATKGKTAFTALPITDVDEVVGVGKFAPPAANPPSLFYKKATPILPVKPAVLTYNNDNNRTGVQSKETVFTPSAISTLGLVSAYSDLAVNGAIYAQVLVVPDVYVNGGYKDLALVATTTNHLYSFNTADGTLVSDKILSDPEQASRTNAGIMSTPVVDYDRKIAYVVAQTTNGVNISPYWLMAFDLQQQKVVRYTRISGSFPKSTGARETFDETKHVHRPALLLQKGSLYVAFGAQASIESVAGYHYHGWLFRYDAETFENRGIFNTTPNEGDVGSSGATGAGIWQAGGGVTADDAGNIYVNTANGSDNPGMNSYGDSMVRLSPRGFSLQFRGRFGADDAAHTLQINDWDFGGGGVVAIPGTNTVVGGGKDGKWFLANSSTFEGTSAAVAQSFQAYTNQYDMSWRSHVNWDLGPHIHGQPVFWNNTLYHQAELDILKAWTFNPATGTLSTTPATSSDNRTSPMGDYMHGREALSVNGSTTSSAVLWVRQQLQDEDGNYGCEGKDNTVTPNPTRPYVARFTAYSAVPSGGQLQCLQSITLPSFGIGTPPTIAGGLVFIPYDSGTGAYYVTVLKLGTGAIGFPDCVLTNDWRPNCMGQTFKGTDARAVTTTGDWASGSYKAECQSGQGGVGMSLIPGTLQARSLYCGRAYDNHFQPHSTCHAVNFAAGGFDPGSTNLSAECATGEYVAGVAQSQSTGALTKILCCTGASLAKNSCATLPMSASNSHEPGWVDLGQLWDYGTNPLPSLAECNAGRYLVGVSRTNASSGPGHALRCCSP